MSYGPSTKCMVFCRLTKNPHPGSLIDERASSFFCSTLFPRTHSPNTHSFSLGFFSSQQTLRRKRRHSQALLKPDQSNTLYKEKNKQRSIQKQGKRKACVQQRYKLSWFQGQRHMLSLSSKQTQGKKKNSLLYSECVVLVNTPISSTFHPSSEQKNRSKQKQCIKQLKKEKRHA